VLGVVLGVRGRHDRLATGRVGAVSGVQVLGSGDEPGVDVATRLEARDAPIDVGEAERPVRARLPDPVEATKPDAVPKSWR